MEISLPHKISKILEVLEALETLIIRQTIFRIMIQETLMKELEITWVVEIWVEEIWDGEHNMETGENSINLETILTWPQKEMNLQVNFA